MSKMKKYISLFLCAALAIAACNPVIPERESNEYAGAKASVELSTTERIPAEGGTLKAVIHRSPAFYVSVPKTADWLTCSVADSTVTVTVKANTSAVARYAHVSVIDNDLKISITSFDVVQQGSEKEVVRKNFNVSTTNIEVKADDTQATFNVTGEVAWTVSSNNTLFTVSPASGSGEGTVTVSFPANTTPEEVNADISVATDDEGALTKSYVVHIKQAASNAGKPAVKPAAGTVLAEWEFDTPNVEALRVGGFEQNSSSPEVDAPGNMGGAYVPSNVSGNGRLEFYNGVDKSTVKTKTCVKRAIGSRGEPVVYGTWEGDWFIWSAEYEAPLKAGTKLQLNFALRPSTASVMKYWKCEYLDGDSWVELNTIELEFHSNAAGTAADPKQINTFIKETATLTKDTPSAQFRFTCPTNATAGDGSPLDKLSSNHVLRFAGKWSDATDDNKYLQVPENPKIMVVE